MQPMLVADDEVAGWRVERLLDDGPMSATFRVVRDSDVAALKVLHLRSPAFSERLFRAASAMLGVDHDNLVRVRGVLDVNGMPGVLSDYVEGSDLTRWLGAGRRDLRETLRLFHGIVSGLAAAHAVGLVHRNLKPSKILLSTVDDRLFPRVNDFLLGKVELPDGAGVTQMGTTFGTPQYMSPEQFRGASMVDARADLFSAGCILYEMTCGVRPFNKPDLMGAYRLASNAEYLHPTRHRPDLPDAVVTLIASLLRPDPDDRAPHGSAVLEQLMAPELWVLVAPDVVGRPDQDTTLEMMPVLASEAPTTAVETPQGTTPGTHNRELNAQEHPADSPRDTPPPRRRQTPPLSPKQVPLSEAPTPVATARTRDPRPVAPATDDTRNLAILALAAVALLVFAAVLGYVIASAT